MTLFFEIAGLVSLVAILTMLVALWPDIARYWRISTM
jgi:hypothetical protein